MAADNNKLNKSQSLIDQFNMLWFIMALGFGGTSIVGFAFLNNTIVRNPPLKGLLYLDKINEFALKTGGAYQVIAGYMKVHMLLFGILHIVALLGCTVLYVLWRRRHPQQ